MADLRLSREEQEAFLAGVHYAIVAIPANDKAPLLTPSWYRYDPTDGIVFTCLATSEKAKRMSVGTPVSVNVQDTSVKWGAAYVTVEGEVAAIDPDDDHAELRRLAERYYGKDAELYMGLVPDDWVFLVVRVRPKRWLSRDYKKRTRAT